MIVRVPTVVGLWYSVRCDHCGDESVPLRTESDARKRAEARDGFRGTGPIDLCGACWCGGIGGQECA